MKQSANRDWPRACYVTAAVFALYVIQHAVRRIGAPIETVLFSIAFNSIALTGLTMIAASYLMGPLAILSPTRWVKHRELRKPFGLIGLAFVVLHAFLALAVLTPAYYPKFFSGNGMLSRLGEVSILTGALGLVLLFVIAATSLPSVAEKLSDRGWRFIQRSGLIAVIASVIHFAVFKWRGWLDVAHWNNFVPPGTLVVTAFVVFVFLMRLAAFLSKRRYG